MIILAIETSCDETAAALLEIKAGKFNLFSNTVASSVELHKSFGGIVPEVAARKQVEFILPVVATVLKAAVSEVNRRAFDPRSYRLGQLVDYIAVTNGPGLVTSLRVGVEAAKSLAYAWDKPLVAVNHLEGHIYSALLNKIQNHGKLFKVKFPVLALVVSGGHTELVLMKDYLNYKVIGKTLDDAAGEAFDKTAKILGLGYPGGPLIASLAAKGTADKIKLPRPMLNSGDYNFSFSGIKTSVLYLLQKTPKAKKHRKQFIYDICASFQEACVDVLVSKTITAAKQFKVKTILLGGGVAANMRLRVRLAEEVNQVDKGKGKIQLLLPDIALTGDNALMIALAAYYKIKKKKFSHWRKINTDPNLSMVS